MKRIYEDLRNNEIYIMIYDTGTKERNILYVAIDNQRIFDGSSGDGEGITNIYFMAFMGTRRAILFMIPCDGMGRRQYLQLKPEVFAELSSQGKS